VCVIFLQGVQVWARSLVLQDLHCRIYTAEGVGVFTKMFREV
jgi:hypothetical protein